MGIKCGLIRVKDAGPQTELSDDAFQGSQVCDSTRSGVMSLAQYRSFSYAKAKESTNSNMLEEAIVEILWIDSNIWEYFQKWMTS